MTNLFTVITHNTCNISDTTKLYQLFETMSTHKIDFYRLSETYYPKGIKFKTQYHPTYIAFWSTKINRHAGIGIILHQKWSTYIQSTYLHNDRFIYIDLFFKDHIKVRIITIYVYANPTNRLKRLALQQ